VTPPPAVNPPEVLSNTIERPAPVVTTTTTDPAPAPAAAAPAPGVKVLGVSITRGSLPLTGGNVIPMAITALALILAGSFLARLGRRRAAVTA
jgi:hypothetical protein